jgi:hypothetical protein
MVPDCSLSSVSAGGATGGCAGTATAASARYGARLSAIPLAHGGKEGESTVGVHPLTLNTGYRIIGLPHRAQDIELALTIVTGIFVDRHSDHLLQLFAITFYLSLLIWSSPSFISHRHSERPKGAERLKGVEESPCRGHSCHCKRRFLDSLRSLGMTYHGEPE